MYIAAPFTIAKTWKQAKCVSAGEWVKKMWYTYTVEYYSTTRKNEIPPFVATWMILDDVMLSDISQTEKDKYCMTSPVCGILKSRTQRNRVEWWLPGAGGRGSGEMLVPVIR